MTQEQKDIIEIKHEVGRLRHHFETYKTDVTDIKDSIKEVKLLLGGSALNGNKGFIHLMQQVSDKVELLERQNEKTIKDLDNIKFWGRGASGILFATILVIINYIKDKV